MDATARSETLRIADSFSGYLAEPAAPTGRAVVVLQEIFGVTRKIRAYCDLFAQAGYTALAPDMFWRIEPGMELAHSESDLAKALDLLKRFSDPEGLNDIDACVAMLRARGAKKVGVVGYCMGGKLVGLAAATGRVDAGVSYYGVGLEKHLDELRRVKCPLQMHFGAKDTYLPESARQAIAAALDERSRRQIYVYPEAGHAFFRPDLKGSDSALAWERTTAFFNLHLSDQSSPAPAGN